MLDTHSGPRGGRRPRLARLLPIGLIAAAAIAFFALGLHRYLSFETLRDSRSALLDLVRLHPIVAPVSYILLYAVVTACSLPGALVMTLTGGFLFGTVLGATYTVIGATAGATLLFIAARTAFADMLRARAGGALKMLEAGFRENAFSYLLVLRLVPIFPFFVVNLAAAFLGAALPVFVAATFIGIIPGTTVFSSVGSGLGTVFDSGAKPDLGVIFTWPILGPLIGLALLSLVPVIYKRLKRVP
jgi:uncharacterized membrane protein YdjX (TVP38/TMEM64 family)